MIACNSINTGLELTTLAVLAVLLTSCILRWREGSASRFFISVVAGLFLTTLGDLFAWMLTGATVPGALAATTIGNVVCYLCGAITYTLYALLVFREVGNVGAPKTLSARIVLGAIIGLGILNVTLLLVNPRTGLLYTIDANNTFTWGPWNRIPDNIMLAQLLLVLVAVFAEGSRSRTDTITGWMLLGALPALIILVENVFPSLMLIYPTLALTLIPVHVWEQHIHEMTIAEREREAALARTDALAEQIKPHYISNTLVAIQQLVAEDPHLARKTIQQFSLYLRDNYEALQGDGKASFTTELEHARRYVAIEQADPSSQVQLECDLGPTDFELPALSLQPLVENAVRHGLGPKPGGGVVRVSTFDAGDAWLVVVYDDGVGFPAGAHEGVGISNVRERLELLCGGSLELESDGAGTRVTMRVPKSPTIEGGRHPLRHLVIDDRQLAVRALAEVVLAVDPGGVVDVGTSAAEALAALDVAPYDVIYLDIEMPGTDGFALARQIQERNELANIIFVTGHPGYALEAHGLFPSGFLVKPVVEEDIERVLANLRHPIAAIPDACVQVRCFGNFEAFAGGLPLAFERRKTKELFAYLIDRRGAEVTVGEAVAVLWEDASASSSKAAQLRNLIHDLRTTLDNVGAGDVLLRRRGTAAVDCSRIDCDYYRLEAGDREARANWHGEYMSQYSWAESTCAYLQRREQRGR